MGTILVLVFIVLIISAIYGQKRKTACRKKAIEKKAEHMGCDLHFEEENTKNKHAK